MPTKKKTIKVYVESDEYEMIRKKADEARESVSAYLKRLGLGHKMTSKTDARTAAALLKANADLGRLGGLFKLAITEGRVKMLTEEFRRLLRQIEQSHGVVAECSQKVVDCVMDKKLKAKAVE